MNEQIFLFVDERIPRNLIEVATQTIRDAGVIYHNTPVILAGSDPFHGLKGSYFTEAAPIVRKDSGYGTQRDAGRMIGKIHELLRKDGRRVVFITADDLTSKSNGRYLNFCFGLAQGYYTVISMVRFGSLPAREQEIILARLIMHELGHLYNIAADSNREKTEDNIGMHCTDELCVMRQGLSMDAIRRNFLLLEKCTRHVDSVKLKYYCPLCMKDVDKHFEPVIKKKSPTESTLPPLPPKRKAV